MKKKMMNLQIFADGGEGAVAENAGGTSGSNAQTGNNGGNTGNQSHGYSFEQAEEIANARAERATKAALSDYFKQQGMSEAEVASAIAAYKAAQEAKKPDIKAIEAERDAAKAELARVKNTATLTAAGIRDEFVDYALFEISKMVTDKKDFKTAAKEWIQKNPSYTGAGYRVETGTRTTGTSAKNDTERINEALKNAFRR